MAIYHFHDSVISRGQGQSVVAAAAYQLRAALYNERDGETKDYTQKAGQDLLFSGVYVPKNAPEWARDPQGLWNGVERAEDQHNKTRAKSATLAHNIDLALMAELTAEQNRYALQDFIREAYVREGYGVQASIHGPEQGGDGRNIHAHLLVTLRTLNGEGFSAIKPRRDRGQMQKQIYQWREAWAQTASRHLRRHGQEQAAARVEVGHLPLEEQRQKALERGDREHAEALAREATQHLGPKAARLERRGLQSERGDINRAAHAEASRHKQEREREREQAELARQIAEAEREAQREADRQAEAERQEQARRREAEERRKAAEIEAQQRAEAKRREQERRAEADRQRQAEKERLRAEARQQKEERRQAAETKRREQAEQAPEQAGAFKRLLDRWTAPRTPAARESAATEAELEAQQQQAERQRQAEERRRIAWEKEQAEAARRERREKKLREFIRIAFARARANTLREQGDREGAAKIEQGLDLEEKQRRYGERVTREQSHTFEAHREKEALREAMERQKEEALKQEIGVDRLPKDFPDWSKQKQTPEAWRTRMNEVSGEEMEARARVARDTAHMKRDEIDEGIRELWDCTRDADDFHVFLEKAGLLLARHEGTEDARGQPRYIVIDGAGRGFSLSESFGRENSVVRQRMAGLDPSMVAPVDEARAIQKERVPIQPRPTGLEPEFNKSAASHERTTAHLDARISRVAREQQERQERTQTAERGAQAFDHEQQRRADRPKDRPSQVENAEARRAEKEALERQQAEDRAKLEERQQQRQAAYDREPGRRFTLPTGERVTGYGFTQPAPQAPGNENRPEARQPEPKPREERPEQAPQAPPRPDPAQERAEAWERLQRRFQSARTPAARGFEKAQEPEKAPQPEPPRRNTEQREDFNKLRVPSRTERPASIGETHTPTADLWKADRLARAQREEAERQRQSEAARREAARQQEEAQQKEQEARRQKDEDEGERERTHAPANGNKPKSRAEEYREKMRQAYEEARNRGRTRDRD